MRPALILLLALAARAPAAAATFDAGGVNLRYVDSGSGPAVVLLHGMSGSASTAWINPGTMLRLSDAGYRAIALDQRGHGGSDKPHDPAQYGMQMVHDVARLLDHLGVEQAHIVGYSMGAKVANAFRVAYPQRILTVTLGGYGWPWASPEIDIDAARRSLIDRPLMPGNDLDAIAAMLAAASELDLTQQDIESNALPVLSIVADADEVVPRADVLRLRRLMPGVVAVDVSGTHAGPLGGLYSAGFSAAIIDFIGATHAP